MKYNFILNFHFTLQKNSLKLFLFVSKVQDYENILFHKINC